MPSRNTKRAPAPKHRGKNNNNTRTNTAAHSTYPSQLNNNHNNHGSSSSNRPSAPTPLSSLDIHRLRAAPTRPPPGRLSKLRSMTQPAPAPAYPSSEGASAPHSAASTGFSFARNATQSATTTPSTAIAATSNTSSPSPPPPATASIERATTAAASQQDGGVVSSAPRGFTYLSPQALAVARTAATEASGSTTSSSAQQQQQQQQFQVTPLKRPSSVAESSLARLRSMASGAPPLVLSPSSPGMLKNEESPLQAHDTAAQLSSASAPSTPYTPDLVRRLAELNGTPYKQAIAVLRVDRLKRARATDTGATAATAAAPRPRSPSLLSAFRMNEEEEEAEASRSLEGLRLRSASLRDGPTSMAPRDDGTGGFSTLGVDLENEEDDHRSPPSASAVTARVTEGLTAISRLSRLRAANRVDSAGSHPESPLSAPVVAGPAEATTFASPSATGSAGLDVASRLALLRQRIATSPASPAFPSFNSPAASPPPGPLVSPSALTTTATTAAVEAAPTNFFMNLERMRVGHRSPPSPTSANTTAPLPFGTSSPPLETTYLSKNLLKTDPDHQSTQKDKNNNNTANKNDNNMNTNNAGWGGFGDQMMISPALLRRADTHGSFPTPPASPVPPTSIDAIAQEEDELRRLEAHLQRFRDQANAQPHLTGGRGTTSTAATAAKTTSEGEAGSTAAGASPKAKRAVRRSQRRRTTALAKKESAVETLVKGRRSTQRLSGGGGTGGASGSTAGLTSAQMWARLRRLAAPVPVGEVERRDGAAGSGSNAGAAAAAAASTLPPSWSSSSPFAALASPNLYGMLHSAARDHLVDAMENTNSNSDDPKSTTDATATGTATANNATVVVPLPLYNYPSMTSSPPPPSSHWSEPRRLPASSSARHDALRSTSSSSITNNSTASFSNRSLPASAQCIVFDTSSLLDSEPGVLNLLLERAHVCIPFKVLDELDHMHKGGTVEKDAASGSGCSGGSSSVARVVGGGHDKEWRRKRAHDLRNWIASCVGAANTHLMLQKRTEVVEAYDRRTANNDDQILGYAVYLRRQREKVIFVTEDKFLRIKAAAEIGRAYSYAEVRQFVGMPAAATSTPSTTARNSVKRRPLRRVRGRR